MDQPRIAPGGLRELGVVNYAFCTIAGRVIGGERPHVFTTLGRQRRLFRGWLHFSGRLMPGGLLPRRESELVILRIATLRDCEYERRHHVRIGRRAGVTQQQIDHLDDLTWSGWTSRELALLQATTQVVETKGIDDAAWAELAAHLDEPRLIELLLLCGQYDSLATTLLTLRVQPE
ncbi:carboxymuconolactone decarboxylase family protein [Aeromicrobium fastidiosum]|uniref:Carboxymuconolactone decarboxylase family protein n=1 Tax=Aeromicrobium fastidiosum TaxID=52699 RepID=A0A641AP67_9ACTN|nr:carboxymuconolactone decarboxylase family protein [Aeromicrobium fastidiosum]KAA1378666.1 carboxymuconolactone decarboxylase family protein [Aeromicrobium fastidiosum]MBP2392351.1 AhpD family alkylhydroperoxidase [Aeromicrobium fastidiosum]